MLTLVLRETLVIWEMTPCVPVYLNRPFGVTSVRIIDHGCEVRTREFPNTKTVRRQDVRTCEGRCLTARAVRHFPSQQAHRTTLPPS
jgi:hypothetical protein